MCLPDVIIHLIVLRTTFGTVRIIDVSKCHVFVSIIGAHRGRSLYQILKWFVDLSGQRMYQKETETHGEFYFKTYQKGTVCQLQLD